jgi:phosphocarrier protein HPr
MITKQLAISNRLGLHARAAGMLVRLAGTFTSQVTVEKDGSRVNAKSILGLMMLAAPMGSTVTVAAEGPDEEAALAAVEDLLERKFDEE